MTRLPVELLPGVTQRLRKKKCNFFQDRFASKKQCCTSNEIFSQID
jgi:hypothetical protein